MTYCVDTSVYFVLLDQFTNRGNPMTTIDKTTTDKVFMMEEANLLADYLNNTDDWHYRVDEIDRVNQNGKAKVMIIDPTDGYEIGYMQG